MYETRRLQMKHPVGLIVNTILLCKSRNVLFNIYHTLKYLSGTFIQ
jgi:hypothetical protein